MTNNLSAAAAGTCSSEARAGEAADSDGEAESTETPSDGEARAFTATRITTRSSGRAPRVLAAVSASGASARARPCPDADADRGVRRAEPPAAPALSVADVVAALSGVWRGDGGGKGMGQIVITTNEDGQTASVSASPTGCADCASGCRWSTARGTVRIVGDTATVDATIDTCDGGTETTRATLERVSSGRNVLYWTPRTCPRSGSGTRDAVNAFRTTRTLSEKEKDLRKKDHCYNRTPRSLNDIVAPRAFRHLLHERVEVEVLLRVVERLDELLEQRVVRVEPVTKTQKSSRLLVRQVLRRTRHARMHVRRLDERQLLDSTSSG